MLLRLGLRPRSFAASTPLAASLAWSRPIQHLCDAQSNVTPNISDKIGVNHHLNDRHPLGIIKGLVEASFPGFDCVDDLHPVVTTKQCFDSLMIPEGHVSRAESDTYYVTRDTVLRTHTSAHQTELLRSGRTQFLVTGDVYRRDEVDASHYPAFHQMEGVCLFGADDLPAGAAPASAEATAWVEDHLKASLEGMVDGVFGPVEKRWVDAHFPFTDPSLELEIYFNGEWLEVLGCGVVQRQILDDNGAGASAGWAFGLGLERLAMVLFDIPDIRLFWSTDPRFTEQFAAGKVVQFQPFSKYPPCFKDITFWLPDTFHENDFAALVRSVAGDLVEQVETIDDFVHPKTGRASKCFRITYRSMERSLTNDEVDALQVEIRDAVAGELGAELR